MVAKSRKQVMELVRCKMLEDKEASIQALQEELEQFDQLLPEYQKVVATILERLQEQSPEAHIVTFRGGLRLNGTSCWRITVAEWTKFGPEDNGNTGLARRIRNELGAHWLEVVEMYDKP